MIIDVHAHHFFYENPEEIIKENEKQGVILIIESGIDPKSNRIVLEEKEKYSIVEATLGFHPTDILKYSKDDIEKEIEFIEKNKDKILGIGEIGLDYYWVKDEEKRKIEKYWFEKFLELAEKINKPVIIHSRDAERKCLEILKSYNLKVIMHSFWKPKLTKEVVDQGFYVSIPAFVYKDKGLQKIAKEVPIDLILTETDAPFLDPIEKRNNRSWKIKYGLEKISEIKRVDISELKIAIKNNLEKVFNIKL